ncbi:MAG: hypothetical protein M4579_006146 [Chaenotheca gracillima]|nr:MAG: hypothetical protein M4579_006146 [Chaenotheca gracillima]
MPTHRAAVLSSTSKPLTIEAVPTPTPTSGQVLVRPLTVPIVSYTREILTGQRPYPLALPFVPGISAIARIEATGSDTTNRTPGQLVYVDPVVRARDDHGGEQNTIVMQGYMAGFTPGAQKLSHGDWRNGSWAERMLVPLESTYPIDEEIVVQKLGYSPTQLAWLNVLLVPYGGWVQAGLQPGETAIVCFATGNFGSVAIDVALAMGAGRVVAVGRNAEKLRQTVEAKHDAGRVALVALTGDVETDTAALKAATPGGRGADVFLDLAPESASATAAKHVKAAISTLKVNGRAVLMGGIMGDLAIPYADVMLRNIKLLGRFMYEREAPARLIGLVESGKIHLETLRTEDYGLDHIEAALDAAQAKGGAGMLVALNHEK